MKKLIAALIFLGLIFLGLFFWMYLESDPSKAPSEEKVIDLTDNFRN